MKHKYKMLFIQILMIFSLISFGFASWEITGGATTIENEIYADSFVDSSKIIKINTELEGTDNGIKTLKYYDNGFYNEDGSIGLTTTIEINYTISIADCQNQFNVTEYQGVVITIDLGYILGTAISYNIFETNENQSFSSDVSVSTISKYGSQSEIGYTFKFAIDHKSITESTMQLKVIYTLSILNDSQYALLYNSLNNESLEFLISARVDGYTGGGL